jgi:hypothetical protein
MLIVAAECVDVVLVNEHSDEKLINMLAYVVFVASAQLKQLINAACPALWIIWQSHSRSVHDSALSVQAHWLAQGFELPVWEGCGAEVESCAQSDETLTNKLATVLFTDSSQLTQLENAAWPALCTTWQTHCSSVHGSRLLTHAHWFWQGTVVGDGPGAGAVVTGGPGAGAAPVGIVYPHCSVMLMMTFA